VIFNINMNKKDKRIIKTQNPELNDTVDTFDALAHYLPSDDYAKMNGKKNKKKKGKKQ